MQSYVLLILELLSSPTHIFVVGLKPFMAVYIIFPSNLKSFAQAILKLLVFCPAPVIVKKNHGKK